MSVADPILQARRLEGDFAFPWKSFAEFIRSRVEDPQLADRAFLVYVDEDCGIEREYRYAEFGERLERLVSFMREVLGLRRGDRVTTVLFNHDQTVLLYFAAWILGIAVVPINVEESAEKKRYILEHSEAAAVFCWKAYMKEVESLCTDLPALRTVIGVEDDGCEVGPIFNHDQTVLLYFAAWILGIAVVPINVEESAEKKRYILEHSEAAAVFCWKAYMKEVESLCTDLPALRTVIGVEDDGCEVGPIFNR